MVLSEFDSAIENYVFSDTKKKITHCVYARISRSNCDRVKKTVLPCPETENSEREDKQKKNGQILGMRANFG